MIVRIGILQKKEGITTEEFHKHWLGVHRQSAIMIPGLRRYHQNHVMDSTQRGLYYARSPQVIDGFSKVWFDDQESMQSSSNADVIKTIAEDEARFIGNLQLIVAIQNVVVPMEIDKTLIKRMSFFKRRTDVDPETFKREWWEKHSKHVRSFPGIKGYTQNLVIERTIERKPCDYEDMPVDGVSELWFQDISSLEAAFASPIGQGAMSHADTFVEAVTTFIVETHQII